MSKQNRDLNFLNKLAFSFLVTPAVPAAIFSCIGIINWSPKRVEDGASVFGALFLVAYSVAGVHTLILGLPAFLLGKWLNAIRWWTCVPIAFVIGGSSMAVGGRVGWSAFSSWGLSWGLFGAIGGLAFWLLWRFYVCSDEPVEALDSRAVNETAGESHP